MVRIRDDKKDKQTEHGHETFVNETFVNETFVRDRSRSILF